MNLIFPTWFFQLDFSKIKYWQVRLCKCYDGRVYAIWANMRMVINILLYFRAYFPYLLTCIYFSVTSVVELKEDIKRRHQKASKGMKKHRKASKDIERHQNASKGIKMHHNASKRIEGHQKPLKGIKRHQKTSKGIKRHQKNRKALKGIKRHRMVSKGIKCYRKASRGTKRHQNVLVFKNSPLRSH